MSVQTPAVPPLVRRIQSHNIVNGVAFVVCEFALMTTVVATLGVIWMLNGMPLHALAAAGIVANCLCVIGLGVRAWRSGERGSPLRLLFSSAHRNSLSKEHPRMSEDTLLIGLATLIPLGLTAFALVDLMTAKPH